MDVRRLWYLFIPENCSPLLTITFQKTLESTVKRQGYNGVLKDKV